MKQKGFTLVELMIVIAITAVLGMLGVAEFKGYSQVQALQTSTSDVVAMLNLAKSRAQSQIKPSSLCPTDLIIPGNNSNLYGYRVVISGQRYRLFVSCSTSVIDPATDISGDKAIVQEDKKLPANTTFNGNFSFFFPVQTGGVRASGSSPWSVGISSSGKTKTITINDLGGISL